MGTRLRVGLPVFFLALKITAIPRQVRRSLVIPVMPSAARRISMALLHWEEEVSTRAAQREMVLGMGPQFFMNHFINVGFPESRKTLGHLMSDPAGGDISSSLAVVGGTQLLK